MGQVGNREGSQVFSCLRKCFQSQQEPELSPRLTRRDGRCFNLSELAAISGLPGECLGVDPVPAVPTFLCPLCSRVCFDGAIATAVRCACGASLLRSEDDSVQLDPMPLDATSAMFHATNQSFPGEFSELLYVDVGVFVDDRERSVELCEELRKFFRVRRRFVSEGDCFAYGTARFKVVRAFPRQGAVGKGTQIACGVSLHVRKLQKVHLRAISPHAIDSEIVGTIIQPHFSREPLHIHESAHLIMRGLECICVHAEPSDGFVDSQTDVSWEEVPVQRLTHVFVAPYKEDLPSAILSLRKTSLSVALSELYIRPHFLGHYRQVSRGEQVEIQHVTFKVMETRPETGVVTDDCIVRWNGRLILRNRRNHRLTIPTLAGSSLIETGHPEISSMELALFRTRETRRLLTNMLALLNEMDVVVPIDSDYLQQLPVRVLVSKPDRGDFSACMICLCEFEAGEEVRTLPCFHFFHVNCIDKWMHRSRFCPVCKHSIAIVDSPKPSEDFTVR